MIWRTLKAGRAAGPLRLTAQAGRTGGVAAILAISPFSVKPSAQHRPATWRPRTCNVTGRPPGKTDSAGH